MYLCSTLKIWAIKKSISSCSAWINCARQILNVKITSTLLKLSFSQSNYFHLCTFTICVSVSSRSPALLLAYIMGAALLNVNGKIYLVKHRLSDAEMRERSDTLNASLCRIRPRPRPTRLRLVNSWWRRWTHHCRGFQLSQPCQQKSRRCQSAFSEYPWRTRHAYLISFCVCPIRWKNLELVLNLYA